MNQNTTTLKRSIGRTTLILCFIFLATTTYAQKFMTPFEWGIPPSQHCYVIKQNGEKLEGKTRFAISLGRGIKTISMKLPSGDIEKFTADELLELGFKNNGFTQVVSTIDQLASVRKATEANWDQINQQEYIIYSNVTLPSGKQAMMQLINPGFDSRIKVYYSLGSRKTSGIGIPLGSSVGPFSPATLKLTGGRQRAYWVSKDNGKVLKLKRGNYNKKKFEYLFGDNPEMLLAFERPYRFQDFCSHVLLYEKVGKK